MATVNIGNVPQNLGLVSAWSVLSQDAGLAKASKYFVNIRSLPFLMQGRWASNIANIQNDLGFLCEQAEFGSRAFDSLDARYYGPNFKQPYNAMYEDLNLTFLVRENFGEREFFDTWMELIQPTNSFDFNYRDEYATEIEIFQLSDVGREARSGTVQPNGIPIPGENPARNPTYTATYHIVYERAYPLLVAAQQASWGDDNFSRLTVTFTYVKWRRAEGLNPPRQDWSLIAPKVGLTEEDIDNYSYGI